MTISFRFTPLTWLNNTFQYQKGEFILIYPNDIVKIKTYAIFSYI